MAIKYSPADREQVFRAISEARKDKLHPRQMVERFNELGIPTASGKPWTFGNLMSFMSRYRRALNNRQEGKEARTVTPAISSVLLETIIAESKTPRHAARTIAAYLTA